MNSWQDRFGELPAVIELPTLEEQEFNCMGEYHGAVTARTKRMADRVSRLRHENWDGDSRESLC